MKLYSRISLVLAVVLMGVATWSCGGSGDGTDQEVTSSVCSCLPEDECTATASECLEPVACEGDEACQTDNPCVQSYCKDGQCKYQFIGGEGCCETNSDCEDEDLCSKNTCSMGICGISYPDPLCCSGDSDCDDLNLCTTGACLDSKCTYTVVPGCCNLDAECNDLDPCTRDRCVSGVCLHPVLENESACTCLSPEECGDNNPCTLDQCLNSQCSYLTLAQAGIDTQCCDKDEDCDDHDSTTDDRCLEHMCAHSHVKVCKLDSDCDDGSTCTTDTCVGGYCEVIHPTEPGCCDTDADCDNGSDCSIDTCVDRQCQHQANLDKPGCCLSDEVCDDGVACTQDVCTGFMCDWIPQGEGCCHDGSDCPISTLPCTTAVCEAGTCKSKNVPNCCTTSPECDDGNDCTEDTCELGSCYYGPVAGCCHDVSDCDDGEICTQDLCNDGECTHTMVQNCCTNPGTCNDSDPCTIDSCEDNVCHYEEAVDCCRADWECADEKEIECQVPHCSNGNCVFTFENGCCLEDSDCIDNFPVCTIDSCGLDNQCIHELAPEDGCCMEDTDCVAEDPCLQGHCKNTMQCEFSVIPGCCKEDGECDDSDDVCTVDTCEANVCVYRPTDGAGCCVTAEHCVSSDLCLEALCGTDHLCYEQPIPNCCKSVEDCQDEDPLAELQCTIDECIQDRCVWTATGAQGCCESNSDCYDSDYCLAGTCNTETGICSFEPIEGCCHEDAECNDGDDVCTDDFCVDTWCTYQNTGADGCCEDFTWSTSFDEGTNSGFVFASSGGSIPGFEGMMPEWQVTGGCGKKSAPSALYFGLVQNLFGGAGCVYVVDLMGMFQLGGAGTATSPAMTLPADQDYHMNFALIADISSAAATDLFTISVKPSSGSAQVVWTKAEIQVGPEWQDVSVDLSAFAGQTIQVEFNFNASSSTSAVGKGVLIDDLSVTADCNIAE